MDGCFWHGCPGHYTAPKRNQEYWADKIRRNIERDRDTDALLSSAGWLVVRVWEHEHPQLAATRLADLVAERRIMMG